MKQSEHARSKLDFLVELLIFGFFASSTIFLAVVRGQYAYYYAAALCAVLIVICMIVKKKFMYLRSVLIPLIFLEFFVGTYTAVRFALPDGYVEAATLIPILSLPYLFMAVYVTERLKTGTRVLDAVVLGLKVTIALQLIWIPIQYLCYHKAGIDVSDLVFNKLLHRNVRTLFIREGAYHPSGFGWHSALIAPVFVLGLLLYRNPIIRAVIILEAMMVGNSTSVAGALACTGLLVLFSLIRYQETKAEITAFVKKTPRALLIALGLLCVAILALGGYLGAFGLIWKNVVILYNRVMHASQSTSSQAHFAYYGQYFKIIRQAHPLQILFGYGCDCSGFPFQTVFHYYTSLQCYVIECDYVNIALNNGIIGFVLFYAMLLYILIRGIRMDRRYVIFVLCILLQGVGYNVQWDYVFVFELVLFVTLKMNVNFFDFDRRDSLAEEDGGRRLVRFLVKL